MAGFWENYGKDGSRFVSEPTSHNFERAYMNQWTKYLHRKENEMLRREKEKGEPKNEVIKLKALLL